MVDWSWTQKLEESDDRRIFSAINISVFHSGYVKVKEDANVDPTSPTSSKLYATRDIKKDEELLTPYFVHDTMDMYRSTMLMKS